jgi:hypothetical protein
MHSLQRSDPVDPVLQNHAWMVRKNLACRNRQCFPGLGIVAPPVLLAFHFEIAKAGNLELSFFLKNQFHQFKHLVFDLRLFFSGKPRQFFGNPVGDIRFCHDALPMAEMAPKITLSA